MGDNFLDSRNCSVNNDENEKLCINDFDDEETPLLIDSQHPKKQSKIDNLRDAMWV